MPAFKTVSQLAGWLYCPTTYSQMNDSPDLALVLVSGKDLVDR